VNYQDMTPWKTDVTSCLVYFAT